MIIRHAEKPVGQINGIDESGNPDPNSLIPQGWQRAGAPIPLVASSFGPLPTPSHVFAPNLFGGGSKRPFETIRPLAAKLGITMNATPGGVSPGQFAPADFVRMVPDALACPGVVLIAWEHEFIPSIRHPNFSYRVICHPRFRPWPVETGQRWWVSIVFPKRSKRSAIPSQLPSGRNAGLVRGMGAGTHFVRGLDESGAREEMVRREVDDGNGLRY